MGKRFDSILKSLSNGSQSAPPDTGGEAVPTKLQHGARLINMSPEERRKTLDLAHSALRNGMTVYMSQDTVRKFNTLLNTSLKSSTMRRLLEEIANGRVVLTKAAKPTTTARLYKEPVAPSSIVGEREVPTVLSVDQLSAGIPFTLKQAAKILNVKTGRLYFQCLRGRIHFQREKSRYFIPATEVARLQVIGL
jgi:hypothetical protein